MTIVARAFINYKNKIMSRSDENENENEEDQQFTRVVGNEVYFNGEICDESILELNVTLRKVQKDLITRFADLMPMCQPSIVLYINSTGGCVFSGLSGMDHIRSMKIPVTTVVDGCCCSAATFLLMGGHTRLMKENSFVLIHQLSNSFWGKYEEMKDEMDTISKLMSHVTNIYRKETNISERKLKKFMKRDVYLNSEECIRYGIVSGVFPNLLCLKSSPEDPSEECDNDESD